ncbi:MAG TPA: hypothetical protein VN408_29635, partial [Actinoplanes sp.]|nr:hypothetical protein [Actinoplanes sp.]
GAELVRKHADSPVTVLAEAALAALTWTDQPDLALPVLLAHAGGDRARVALYAAGRAVRHIDPERLPDLLGPLLSGPVKVTSRKAAVRMLADYGPPATMDILRDAYRAGGQHRDVRAAVVSVARRHLENPVSWEILDSASGGTREEVRAFLDVRPWSIAEEHRPRYAALIVGACRSADREIRREAFDELPPWTRWAGDVSALVTDRVVDVGESMTGHDIQDLVASGGTGWLGEALDRLLALDAADPAPGGPGADRPARRRAEALIRATTTVIDSEVRAELRIPVRRMLGAPAYRSLAVLTLVDLGRLDDLDEIAGLCAGRPDLAARAADRAGTRLRQLPDLIDVAFLGPLITRLTGRADPAGGLLAVALVRVGATFGWADPWRDRLLALREHPEDAVREQAYSIDMT